MPIIFEPLKNMPGPFPQSAQPASSEVHLLRRADPSSCNSVVGVNEAPSKDRACFRLLNLEASAGRSTRRVSVWHIPSAMPSFSPSQERLLCLYGLGVAEKESGTGAWRSLERLEWNVTTFLLRLGLLKQRTACNYPTREVCFKSKLFAPRPRSGSGQKEPFSSNSFLI